MINYFIFNTLCHNYSAFRIRNKKNIISKKFRERFISNIESVLYNKEYKTTNKIELLNGKIVELITTNINLNNEDLLLSIVIDVTEFENTIMSIEQSEKTYKLLLQTLPEGIIIINPKNNKHIYRVNTTKLSIGSIFN